MGLLSVPGLGLGLTPVAIHLMPRPEPIVGGPK